MVPRLVLAVVVAGVAAGPPCPASCSCTWRGGREVMECSNLTFLPSVPHPAADRVGVQEMVVGGGSRVASLIRHQLYDSSLTSLRRLHMAACQLQIIDGLRINELFIPEMARKRKNDEEGGVRGRQAKVCLLGSFTNTTTI